MDSSTVLMIFVFLFTVIVMMWRPFGLNEIYPTTIGAIIVLISGIVPLQDLSIIFHIVSGAAITILSTIIMSIVLESIGFFRWIAVNIVNNAKGSGIRLYIYIILLCFFMTMFFNNDGSILITTPIIIHIVNILRFKPHQKFPYLLSGALIATAASAPIAVSNIANLIALKIVGLTLNGYVLMMFVPSMIGIIVIAYMLYVYFKKDIPVNIPIVKGDIYVHSETATLMNHPYKQQPEQHEVDWWLFKTCMVIVVLVRASFFALSPFGIPIEWIGMVGAGILVILRWYRIQMGIKDIFLKTPWHILLFAFNMYVIVYGLRNVGLSHFIVEQIGSAVSDSMFNASFIMGGLLTVISNLFNNLPAIMIGTLSLMDMGLDLHTLQVAYLANIIGSDIGALLTPVGTLATLIWMFLLKKHGIEITWIKYMRVTIWIIPIGLIVSLISLYFWNEWLLVMNWR
ncbi:arsenic transporter [Bacillus kexueae]|uniref:arsenic transporter n=1 Tax=Aeribacillus kexueae TaxID=2078952 RepID=UPI001FAF7648|nr:arsenic transporter [Bacillus kexueae]